MCVAVCGTRKRERARARERDLASSKHILGVQAGLFTVFLVLSGLDYCKTILNINVAGLSNKEGRRSIGTKK